MTFKMKIFRFKPIGADWLVIFAIILMLSNHSITQFLIHKHTTDADTKAGVDALIQYVELNPLAAWVLKFRKLSLIYSGFFAPAMLIGFYYYIRKKYWYQLDVVYMFALMLFSMFFINFLNDFAALLGFFAR